MYEAHTLSLIRLAFVVLGDRGAAEDIVQDAFLGLYRRWDRLRDAGSAPGYLRGSLLNGCRMVLRNRARPREGAGDALAWESAEATALLGAPGRWTARSAPTRTTRRRSRGQPTARWRSTCSTATDGSVIIRGGGSPIGPVIKVGNAYAIPRRSPGTPHKQGFLEYSAATGRLVHTMGVYESPGVDDFPLFWSDASGKVLIVTISTGNGTRVGILSGQAFTPLPGVANVGAAAWGHVSGAVEF